MDRFRAPTDVQERSWPRIAAGEHLLITAPTGSGKTLTAFLWAIDAFATGQSEPSAGEREGRAPRMKEPSAGEREGLAPRTKEPSAGEREGRAPRTKEPSAGEREGLVPRTKEPSAGSARGVPLA